MQMVKNIPELVKDLYEIQKSNEIQWNTDKMNNRKATLRNISMKPQNSKAKGKILHHCSCQKNSNYNYPEILFLIYQISKTQMFDKALCWGDCGETGLPIYCWRYTKWYGPYRGNLALSNKIINAHVLYLVNATTRN